MGAGYSQVRPQINTLGKTVYTGRRFKFVNYNKKFVAFTDNKNFQGIHKCQIGINYEKCKYIFYDINDLPKQLQVVPAQVNQKCHYIWTVTIPNISTVTVRRDRNGSACYECDMFKLDNRHNTYDYLRYRPDKLKRKVKYCGWKELDIMKDMAVIDVNNDSRRFITLDKTYQTKHLAWLAVCRNWWNFEHVREDLQDQDLCEYAIEANKENVKFVRPDLLTGEMVNKYENRNEDSKKSKDSGDSKKPG